MKNKWSLVIHDVGADYANIWVGTLFPNERKFETYSVKLFKAGVLVSEQAIPKADLERPFPDLEQRFYKYLRFDNLEPATDYEVIFAREQQTIADIALTARVLSQGSLRTLPASLNTDKKPFVVALGSCYYDESDGGKTAGAYNALLASGIDAIKPDVKFLTGDQVYLDIGLDSLSPVNSEISNRIADDYAVSWQSLRGMLRHGGTWMLADDHEFWNNYPNVSGRNPYLWMITASDSVKKLWQKTAIDGIRNVQKIETIRTFTIGDDLSFCFADVRCHRTDKTFLPPADFDQLINWAQSLTSPGVLTIGQPLMVRPGSNEDKNLANYRKQYAALLNALASTGHDILILSGDVHFGRVGSAPLGNNGTILHEVISSPLSNLTGIDGKIASDSAKKIKQFPAFEIEGIPTVATAYPSEWRVSAEKIKSWFFPTNHKKTREHFFTLSFSKNRQMQVKVDLQAWQLRYTSRDGLPRKQFKNTNRIILK